MNIFENKRCPRCNTKMPKEIMVCPSCRLNFVKFENATNAEAKIALKMGEKDRVVYRKGCPKDVSRTKLTLLTVFLGFMGANNYYVGKTHRGVFFTIFFIIGVINAIITNVLNLNPSGELWEVFTFLVLIWGIVLFMWIIDIAKVALNKFKIPVSLPW
mgnify:FL=1